MIEERFAVDGEFREVSGHLVEAMRKGRPDPFFNTDLPYEEWLAVMSCGQSFFADATTKVLKELARRHHDDGVRFNAIQLLDDAGQLTSEYVKSFLLTERDPDTQELLHSLVAT
jgi:hypothetical protein